jgi:two-component system cell cycle response regulator
MSILVAEDNAVIQIVLREMLTHWGYEVILAPDGEDAWNRLRSLSAPRLAIVDWMMPRMQGPELCRRLRAETREPYTYVLMLTSRSETSDIVEGLDAGADDYLTKPFHAQELFARVRAGARMVRMHEQLLAAREELRERACTDDLTRLPNRFSILETLDGALSQADRQGEPLSVVLVDVDRFRQINDSFGHLAGDLVLRECGGRIRAAAPVEATAGRYGGEEFLVVLPGIGRASAVEAGDRILAAIAAETFHAGAASFPVTCSAGVAGRDIPYSADAASLLRAADEALQSARAERRERLAGALRTSTASVSPRP